MSLCQFKPAFKQSSGIQNTLHNHRLGCVRTFSPLRENTVTVSVSHGCSPIQHHDISTREMTFHQLCIALRSFETQGGDSRIADAQLIWHLHKKGFATAEELSTVLGLTNSSISRTTNRLGAKHRHGHAGYGLVTSRKDPREGRRLLFELTAEAKQLFA